MRLSRWLLHMAGWKVVATAPDYDKCLICVAPHTSNWDFILGILAYDSIGRRAGFLMKEGWFFFPLGYLLKAMGGIPVHRKNKKGSVVQSVVDKFRSTPGRLHIAIAPEGTRSRTARWHTGFLQIASQAQVPCILGAIDAPTKTITINDTFVPTGDIQSDLKSIKLYYSRFTGVHPENFTTEEEN